jgi:ribosomal protein S18 acetylase RimI-like enzyme
MVEAFASLPPHQPGGHVRRSAGLVFAITGSPLALFNAVLPTAELVDPEALVDECRANLAPGLQWCLQLRSGIDDALLPVVPGLGLSEAVDLSWPAMVLGTLPTALEAPPGIEVRRVVDDAGFEDHLRATGGDGALGATWLGRGVLDDPRWTLFVGYLDGAPVARSMSFVHDRVVGVYNVGTQAPARRRGFGSALTVSALIEGARAGCTVATLQSSAMARRMYEELGFRLAYRYRAFTGVRAS